MSSDYEYIANEHRLDYGRKLTVWAQDHLANRYADRTHFIFELLLNAEDALAERGQSSLPNSVSFDLKEDGLEVRHFGKPFTPRNVKGVCAINESTKADELTEIGRFGIGSKSVYAFTARPEVHSGDEKYKSFADFLQYHAALAYPEGWQSNQYANPNAIRIMTVHQAKGMQWPVVFVPALMANRFPAAAIGCF